MADTWESSKAAAMKILGKDAKIPEPKVDVNKLSADYMKASKAFDKARDDLDAKVLDLKNANDGIGNYAKMMMNQIDKADFGLDEKNKDDAKKIDQAQKILSDFVKSRQDIFTKNDSDLDELDKHLANIAKYKPST